MNKKVVLLGKDQSYEELKQLLVNHPHIESIDEADLSISLDQAISYDVVICLESGDGLFDLVSKIQSSSFQGQFISTVPDFRISDAQLLKKFYKIDERAPLNPFTYFLPEETNNEELQFVSIPGMVSAAVLPAIATIIKISNIHEFWITVMTPNYVETESRFRAYDVFTYSELGEIQWYCKEKFGLAPKINLIPVHASIDRGLWATINISVSDENFLFEALKQEFQQYPWIRCENQLPSLGDTLHTNEVHIGWKSSEHNVVVALAMDEKRRCGPVQCIQAFNAFFGFETMEGIA